MLATKVVGMADTIHCSRCDLDLPITSYFPSVIERHNRGKLVQCKNCMKNRNVTVSMTPEVFSELKQQSTSIEDYTKNILRHLARGDTRISVLSYGH